MARMKAIEIIPGRLYQRGQFATWTQAQKRALLESLRVDVVVNLWHLTDPALPEGITYVKWPISPTHAPPLRDVNAHLNYLTALLQIGHRILVHCEAGRGRSVWLATELTAVLLALTIEDAELAVRQLVPGASPRTALWDWRTA